MMRLRFHRDIKNNRQNLSPCAKTGLDSMAPKHEEPMTNQPLSDPKSDAVSLLEAELAETLAAVGSSFAEVRKFDESNGRSLDEFGHKRSAAVNDAVRLLAVSAELGNAIAKIRGRSSHNINVLHGDIWPPPSRPVVKPQTVEDAVPSQDSLDEAIAKTIACHCKDGGGTPPEK
jgi:hypothetical protein